MRASLRCCRSCAFAACFSCRAFSLLRFANVVAMRLLRVNFPPALSGGEGRATDARQRTPPAAPITRPYPTKRTSAHAATLQRGKSWGRITIAHVGPKAWIAARMAKMALTPPTSQPRPRRGHGSAYQRAMDTCSAISGPADGRRQPAQRGLARCAVVIARGLPLDARRSRETRQKNPDRDDAGGALGHRVVSCVSPCRPPPLSVSAWRSVRAG